MEIMIWEWVGKVQSEIMQLGLRTLEEDDLDRL